MHQRYKKEQLETRAGLVTDILLYLIPGFLVFIFLPSGLFAYFEGWDFDVSVYYAFVTLTTIGFGDFVAGNYVIFNIKIQFPQYGITNRLLDLPSCAAVQIETRLTFLFSLISNIYRYIIKIFSVKLIIVLRKYFNFVQIDTPHFSIFFFYYFQFYLQSAY